MQPFLRRIAKTGQEKYDVVHIEGIPLAPFLRIKELANRTLFSAVDAWSLRQNRLALQSHGIKRIFLLSYAKFSYFVERTYFHRAQHTHLVSSSDAEYLSAIDPRIKTIVIPVGQSWKRSSYPETNLHDRAPRVGFWGDLNVPHIRAGLDWFLENVWPSIPGSSEDLLTILGRVREYSPPVSTQVSRLIVKNWVADIDEELQVLDILILPDQNGTGLKNRVIHAMGNGLAVIGTQYALEGIPINSGHNAFECDSIEEFTEALIELRSNPQRLNTIKYNASLFASTQYSLETIVNKWEAAYQNIIKTAGDRD